MKTIKQLSRYILPAGILSVTTLLSYITGLLRDRTFSHTFGAGRELDIYNAAFIVPDLMLNIFVASALTPVFIPLFSGLRAQKKEAEAKELATTVMLAASLTILVTAGLAALCMPQLAQFIAPGFLPDEKAQLIHMSRLILIQPIIMAISNVLGCLLISYKQFLWYGLSPIFYNLGLIAGSFLVASLGLPGLALGATAGALLHLAPRIVGIVKSGFRFGRTINFRMKSFSELLKLMGPKMLGHPVEQLKFLGFTRIATQMAAGSVAAISFSRNFQSVPVSMFGAAFAISVFPLLAEAASVGDKTLFIKHLRTTIINILAVTLPAMLFVLLLGKLPIQILLGGGKFDADDISRTALALGAFALAIPTESLIHLLARSFYALKNTITPVCLSLTGLAVSVTTATFAAPRLGLIGIPLGFFTGTLIEVSLLAIFLTIKLKKLSRPVHLTQIEEKAPQLVDIANEKYERD